MDNPLSAQHGNSARLSHYPNISEIFLSLEYAADAPAGLSTHAEIISTTTTERGISCQRGRTARRGVCVRAEESHFQIGRFWRDSDSAVLGCCYSKPSLLQTATSPATSNSVYCSLQAETSTSVRGPSRRSWSLIRVFEAHVASRIHPQTGSWQTLSACRGVQLLVQIFEFTKPSSASRDSSTKRSIPSATSWSRRSRRSAEDAGCRLTGLICG